MSRAKNFPKDGKSRFENLNSQPHSNHKIFNQQGIITKGWYPVCPSHKLKKKKTFSYKLLGQRLVLFRNEEGDVGAMDAFCPHLGADLANGKVVGKNLRCYFHRWEFDTEGKLKHIPCQKIDKSLENISLISYPVQEIYGHIWVYSAKDNPIEFIKPSGLEKYDVTAWYLKEITLFAHHHVMMANGVDLQHFATVHSLDIDFNYHVEEKQSGEFTWKLKGKIPDDNFKGKIARLLLGEEFEYHVKFSGGSLIVISYGVNAKIFGMKISPLNILWGSTPLENGISKVKIFFVTKKRKGFLGKIKNLLGHILTIILLTMLRDEDIEAFPNMRFNTHRLIEKDASLGRFIQLINKCEISDWSGAC